MSKDEQLLAYYREKYEEKLKALQNHYDHLVHEAGEFSNSSIRVVIMRDLDTVREEIKALRALLENPEALQKKIDEDLNLADNPKHR